MLTKITMNILLKQSRIIEVPDNRGLDKRGSTVLHVHVRCTCWMGVYMYMYMYMYMYTHTHTHTHQVLRSTYKNVHCIYVCMYLYCLYKYVLCALSYSHTCMQYNSPSHTPTQALDNSNYCYYSVVSWVSLILYSIEHPLFGQTRSYSTLVKVCHQHTCTLTCIYYGSCYGVTVKLAILDIHVLNMHLLW